MNISTYGSIPQAKELQRRVKNYSIRMLNGMDWGVMGIKDTSLKSVSLTKQGLTDVKETS